MKRVKELLESKEKFVNVGLLSEPPTTTAVANLHHILSHEGQKFVYTTPNITPEMKKAYQNSGINHKHFFTGTPKESIFHAIDDATTKSKYPINLHVHGDYVNDVTTKLQKTHPNLKIKVTAMPHNKGASKVPHPSITREDAKKMFKEEFEIGRVVTNGEVEGEIINLRSTYATIINDGKEHRVWLKDLTLVEDGKLKRDQVYKESFIFKGYKSKNLTRELAEQFRDKSKDTEDSYALLSCLKAVDFIMGVTDNQIIENYSLVRSQFERAKRYTTKFSINISEQLQLVEENCMRMAILEDFRFSSTDKIMIAKMVAATAEIEAVGNDPTTIINRAIIKLRLSQLTPQGWVIVGRILNVATKSGIKWNRDNFSPAIQTMMGLK